MAEQHVRVVCDWSKKSHRPAIRALAQSIADRFPAEHDGFDIGCGEFNLYLYTADAGSLYQAMRPLLAGCAIPYRVYLRRGAVNDPSAPEEWIDSALP